MIGKRLSRLFAVAAAAVMMAGGTGAVGASASAAKTNVQIKTVNFKKVSSKKIKLTWSDAKDKQVKTYLVQRYDASSKKWKTIAKIKSDGIKGNKTHGYTDVLTSSAPQQYRYRVNVKVSDTNKYKAVNGNARYASNIKVCIDPGHFRDHNGGTYGYYEGNATLSIGLALKSYLDKQGIGVYMTRTDGNITLANEYNVDGGNQLNARGHAAKLNNCDLFVSLHTNANSENANGRGTINQASSLNKTVVFVNKTAYRSNSYAINIAHRAGYYITQGNKSLGIPTTEWQGLNNKRPFTYRTTVDNETIYNDKFMAYNEKVKQKGRVIFRTLSGGQDYYAVLRAAADDGVPGMLIEHSYHTVPAFCKVFMSNPDTAKYYAVYDARAIGAGYGFKVVGGI